jgi:hypothetical protein
MTALISSSHTVTRVHRIDGHDWRVLRSGTGSRVVRLLPAAWGRPRLSTRSLAGDTGVSVEHGSNSGSSCGSRTFGGRHSAADATPLIAEVLRDC